MEIAVEKLKGFHNKNQQEALFYSQSISIINLYMLSSRFTAHHQEVLLHKYSSWYVSCVYVDWLLAGYTEKYLLMIAINLPETCRGWLSKYIKSKIMHPVGSYCANVSWCTVHRTLKRVERYTVSVIDTSVAELSRSIRSINLLMCLEQRRVGSAVKGVWYCAKLGWQN